MKIKNIIGYVGLMLVMGLALTACTQEDEMLSGNKSDKTVNGFHVYPVDFNCAAPGYDDDGTTRAVSYSWKEKTSVFAVLTTGSKKYPGFITYENNMWDLITTTDFFDQNSSGTIQLYYFQEANGDNYYMNLQTTSLDVYNNGNFVRSTSIPWDADSLNFSEGTAVYAAFSGSYSFTSSTGAFSVNAQLEPVLWRMRFKGTNGTTITMPAADNDIKYLSAFNWFSAEGVSFSGGARDVTLKVSNGYTPYVYGEFDKTGANKITVRNGNDTFTRNISSNDFYYGKSGYFTLPTASNYSSYGWTKVANSGTSSMVLKDFLVKPMGTVNVNMKTAPYQTIRDEVAKVYTIGEYGTDGDQPWFSLYASANTACKDMTYQGLPFYSFALFSYENGVSVQYRFVIEKSQASNNYMSYLNRILQDFKNMSISMEATSSSAYLARYMASEANGYYYHLSVDDDADNYSFWVSASYYSSSSSRSMSPGAAKSNESVWKERMEKEHELVRMASKKR